MWRGCPTRKRRCRHAQVNGRKEWTDVKPLFEGYYDPTEDEIRKLWASALIVLDTNVLLNLYRFPDNARQEILALLKSQGHRLWIPYQVATEFQRNRLKVLRDEYDKAKALGAAVNKAHSAFRQSVLSVQLNERGSGEEVNAIMEKIAQNVSQLSVLAGKLADGYISPSAVDEVNAFLTELLDGRVGARPLNQKQLDTCFAEAAERYAVGMGPGHLDQAKSGDKYMADGLIYDRQFGDYVLWKQLLAHAAEVKPSGILLITSDVKEDWWLDTKSVSGLRPQPELVMDMQRRGKVSDFWMYTLSDFVKKSKIFLDSKVSENTISDVEQADQEQAEPIRATAQKGTSFTSTSERKGVSFTSTFGRRRKQDPVEAIANAMNASGFTRTSDGMVRMFVASDPGVRGRIYAVLDVTKWPKDPDSLAGLEDHLEQAEGAIQHSDGVILYDTKEPDAFWIFSPWPAKLARRVSTLSPLAIDVLGVSFEDGTADITVLLDERVDIGRF